MKKMKYVLLSLGLIFFTFCEAVDDLDFDTSAPKILKEYTFTEQVVVTFREIKNARQFETKVSTSKDMSDAQVQESGAERAEVNNLHAATTYYMQFRASNGKQWTEWTEVKSYKTADLAVSIETFNVMNDSVYMTNHPREYYIDNKINGKDIWAFRRDAFKNLILEPDNFPDILALQEVQKDHHIQDVTVLLQEFYDGFINNRNIGLGNKGVDARAIFWKKDMFSLVASGDFDGYMSTVSGRQTARFVTYVILKHKATGKEMVVYSKHPTAGTTLELQEIRFEMALCVSDSAINISKKYDIPAIVCGDFNNYPNTKFEGIPGGPLGMKSRGFTDTYDVALDKKNYEYTTSTRIFDLIPPASPNGSKRIDYIFTYSPRKITVSDYEIVIRFKENSLEEREPKVSDHYPIRSTLHLFY